MGKDKTNFLYKTAKFLKGGFGMAKKEPKTDFWVYELLKEANINLEPQGSTIKEINEALKTASKREQEILVILNLSVL